MLFYVSRLLNTKGWNNQHILPSCTGLAFVFFCFFREHVFCLLICSVVVSIVWLDGIGMEGRFWVDCVATKKVITIYPNNKSYITRELKDCINRNKLAFRNHDRMEFKSVQRELNQSLREEGNTGCHRTELCFYGL